MSQCVPNWNLDETPAAARFSHRLHSSAAPQDPIPPTLDYEVAELTWENGQLAMHAFGPPRLPLKPPHLAAGDATWPEKPGGNGTLESIVNQATEAYPSQKQFNDIGPWFDQGVVSASATALTMDALVPCGSTNPEIGASGATRRLINDSSVPGLVGRARMPGCSTRVASCSVQDEDVPVERKKRAREARVAAEWSGRTHSATAGRDIDMDSLQMTADTCERETGLQFTSTCMGSSDNNSSDLPCSKATTAGDHDSVCHSRSLKDAGDGGGKKKRSGKSSVSTKRSRAAAIHNQSERKRRDKINQRMKTLQKLVPNSSKTDKASVLDEAIDYLKQLQAQVQMVNRMNMQPSPAAAAAMMFPMAALQQQQQQQLQMSMMAPMMGLQGMGMGMMPGVMDMNGLAAARPGMPNLHGGATTTSPFLPPMAATWDASAGDRNLHAAAAAAASSAALMMDPMAAFLACQSQPMTLDTYSRMAAMYQQMAQQQQPPPPPATNSKNLS